MAPKKKQIAEEEVKALEENTDTAPPKTKAKTTKKGGTKKGTGRGTRKGSDSSEDDDDIDFEDFLDDEE